MLPELLVVEKQWVTLLFGKFQGFLAIRKISPSDDQLLQTLGSGSIKNIFQVGFVFLGPVVLTLVHGISQVHPDVYKEMNTDVVSRSDS